MIVNDRIKNRLKDGLIHKDMSQNKSAIFLGLTLFFREGRGQITFYFSASDVMTLTVSERARREKRERAREREKKKAVNTGGVLRSTGTIKRFLYQCTNHELTRYDCDKTALPVVRSEIQSR